jgi:hypothetical protein
VSRPIEEPLKLDAGTADSEIPGNFRLPSRFGMQTVLGGKVEAGLALPARKLGVPYRALIQALPQSLGGLD